VYERAVWPREGPSWAFLALSSPLYFRTSRVTPVWPAIRGEHLPPYLTRHEVHLAQIAELGNYFAELLIHLLGLSGNTRREILSGTFVTASLASFVHSVDSAMASGLDHCQPGWLSWPQ